MSGKGALFTVFGHSLRDRSDVECPSDLVDEIGGWKSAGVGQQYGQGTSLSVKGEVASQDLLNEHL